MVYRLEIKKALHRAHKVSNAHIFEATLSRSAAQRRLIDDFLALFGGHAQPLMAQLIEAGKLTLADIQQAGKTLRTQQRKARRSKPTVHPRIV